MQFDSRLLVLLGLGTLKSSNHGAGTTINESDSGSAGKVGPEANQPLILSKLPLPGFRGLTVFGREQHNKLFQLKSTVNSRSTFTRFPSLCVLNCAQSEI